MAQKEDPNRIRTLEEDLKNLKQVVRQMLQPLQNLPLRYVIESISGAEVIPFNRDDPKDRLLLDDLLRVAMTAGEKMNRSGIRSKRPNEVGNYIEPFVKESLNEHGLAAGTPTTGTGKKKAAGYPDIRFLDRHGRPNYLECKTYNAQNVDTTQRAFYLSPSDEFKVTESAHHFIISYEMVHVGTRGDVGVYKCKHFKLLSIEDLKVDVKYEFNSDNRRLYSTPGLILAEGPISPRLGVR